MVTKLFAALTRVRVLNLRELRDHRLRVVTSLIVVAVSSALLIAVLGTYGSLSESIRDFDAAINGTAQLEVASIADSGIDESVAGDIRAQVPDAKSVVPVIRGTAVVDDKRIALVGSDFRARALAGGVQEAAATGLSPGDLDDGVIVGSGTGLSLGQRLSVNGVDVRVVRVVDGAGLNNGDFMFAYLGLAQRLTGLSGKVSSILVVAAPGVDVGMLRDEVRRVVDGRAVVVDPGFRAKQAEVAGSVTRDSTLLVSLISLVIAAFLVFNTMNMAVASRRASLAMVRALGAKRSHLVSDLLAESAVFGFVGGLIGVPIGILTGRWAISRVPTTKRDSVSIVVDYHLPSYAPVVAVIACVLACVAATSLAARSVFAVSPVEAMVSGQVADTGPQRGPLTVLAAVAGVALLVGSWFIAVDVPGRPAIVAGAVYAVGALLVCFALTRPLVRLVVSVARRFGGPGQLAAVNTERAPRRAWATLMTVAVAIAVGMGTSGALDNLVASISHSLDGLGDPDFYVSSTPRDEIPAGAALPGAIADEVRAVPGVSRVVGAQWANVNVGEARILVQGLEPGSTAPFTKKTTPQALSDVLDGRGIILSSVLARSLDADIGSTLRLATPTGYHDLVVRDIVDYISIDSGTAAMSNPLLAQWFNRTGDTYLQIDVEPSADRAAVQEQLQRIVDAHPLPRSGTAYVYTGAQALAATQQQAQQAGAFTVAIQWIVSVAAAIALLNTLLLSVLERRRELGVLRAMGASRRFISRMVVAEAGAIAVVGTVTGLVMGTGLHFLADKILSATTSLDITYSPRPSTLLFVAVSIVLCLVGAFVPAARAARMNITEAIVEE